MKNILTNTLISSALAHGTRTRPTECLIILQRENPGSCFLSFPVEVELTLVVKKKKKLHKVKVNIDRLLAHRRLGHKVVTRYV